MFAQMLAMTVTPLYGQKEGVEKRSGSKRCWEIVMKKAEAKYRAVMGTEWVKTHDIESRLGVARGSVRYYLLDRMREGKVERRNIGRHNREGFEWRWK